MQDVITHTPLWVFAVFFSLLALGLTQRQPRVVKLRTIFILPLAMIIFSLMGVIAAFDIALMTIGLWIIGFFVTTAVGIKLAFPKSVVFSKQQETLTIPGSWVPLLLMMAIFFTKYLVGFASASASPMLDNTLNIAFICMLYGIFSGIFLSRCLVMYKVSKL